VQSLAEFRDLDSLRRHTVDLLPSLVPTNLIAWNEVDVERDRITAVMEPERYSEKGAAAFMTHLADHPVINHYSATGDRRPYAISDFMTAEEFHATGIYRNFYRHLGAEDQISFILPDPRLIIGIALNRDRRGFSQGERRTLNVLRPQLVQAYRNAEDFSRLQRSLEAMQALVEAEGEGLMLLDRRMRIEHCSPTAQEIFERWFDGFGTAALPEPVHAWLEAATPSAAPSVPLVIDRADGHLLVRRVPVADTEALLISEQRSDRSEALLRELGLTPREAQVLVLVTDGCRVADAAARLAISRRTVEKHIEHAYDKLGLDGRVGATNLVRQLERRTSRPAVH
jgi:DNA-binding CsgD family transcriptional regulator